MKDFRSPAAKEMMTACREVKGTELPNIRLGNVGFFDRKDMRSESW